VYHIYRTGSLGTSKLVCRSNMRCINWHGQLFKGLWSWVLARGRKHTVSDVPDSHALLYQCILFMFPAHLWSLAIII